VGWLRDLLGAGAITRGAGPFFILWGIPFVAIGLYLIVGRFLVARREALRTHYAVTDQRVLIESGAFSRRFVEMPLDQLPPVQLEEGSSGVGTITFGTTTGIRVPPGWPTMGAYAGAPAFLSIRDASRVYRIVQEARGAAPHV
jgi:hypothetical protein